MLLSLRRIKTYVFWPNRVNLKIWSCQVKWPALMNDPGSSYCISFDPSWQDKHNDNSPRALPYFCEELLAETFSWPAMTSYMMTSYDLPGGHRPAVALDLLMNCIWIVTDSDIILSWMSNIKWKYSQQGTFALAGSWHDLVNKVIAQQPKVIETCHLRTLC